MNWRLNQMVSENSPRACGAELPVRRRGARGGLIVAMLAACLCGPVTAVWAAPANPAMTQPLGASPSTQPAHATTKGAAQDSAYASREAESKDLENFKGGEPVVIVTSTAVLIVAIVILILLI
jgi:hypothetical protein